MAIADGYRTHDETNTPRYRMPDLLTLEEMKLYFASTYGQDVTLSPISDEVRDLVNNGVGVLPAPAVVGDKDRELAELREKLGIVALERQLGVVPEPGSPAAELDSKTMTREQLEEKYGPIDPPAPPPDDSGDRTVDDPEQTTPVDELNALLDK